MVKFVFCLRRLPHLTREQFQDYWLNHHGPLVRSYQQQLGMARYVQLHTVATPLDAMLRENSGGQEPYDGIAESWWESVQAFQDALMNSEAQSVFAIFREDEKRFIDQPRSLMWFGEEHPVIG